MMIWKPLAAGLAAAALVALSGCGDDSADAPETNGRATNGNGRVRITPVTIDPESIQVTDWQGVEQLAAAHQGHVVVVYLWATFNQPAVNEFPQFVRLCKSHPEDLRCISVNVDYGEGGEPPETLRGEIAEFVGKAGADFEHVISSVPAEELYGQIELPAGIPAVYVYGRDGELSRRFDNEDPSRPEFSFRKEVAPFVEELLEGQ